MWGSESVRESVSERLHKEMMEGVSEEGVSRSVRVGRRQYV